MHLTAKKNGANMKYLFTSFMRWHGHTPSKIQEFVWSGANISNANPPSNCVI